MDWYLQEDFILVALVKILVGEDNAVPHHLLIVDVDMPTEDSDGGHLYPIHSDCIRDGSIRCTLNTTPSANV